MVNVNPRHVRDCSCEDYPCCGHTDNTPSDEPDCCNICGDSGHVDFYCPGEDESYCPDEESDDQELPANLTQVTALVEPINDAIDDLLGDTLMENIFDLMKEQDIGTGFFEADQEIASQIYDQCMEVIGERFKKTM